jgi:hypothetical protein
VLAYVAQERRREGTMKTILEMMCLTALVGCSFDDTEPPPETNGAEESADLTPLDPDSMHCVVRAIAVPIDQDPDVALPPRDSNEELTVADSPRCFPTFSQAIDFATASRVTLPSNATPGDLDESLMPITPGGARYVLGVEYRHSNFRGSTYTFYGSTTCLTNSYTMNRMPRGWNDEISSAKAYSHCNHSYHWEHINLRGSVRDCGRSCGTLGAMNDRTSSIRWTE